MFQVVKAPGANLTYTFDWATWLDADTLSASTWTIDVTDGELSIVTTHTNLTTSTVQLSGGTEGQEYHIRNTITTTGGFGDERTLLVSVQERTE